MKEDKILILGSDVRHIVCSARRAGYNVISIDFFDDVDTLECDKDHITIREDEDIREELKRMEFDHLVIGSHFENFDLPRSVRDKILGNSSEKMAEVGDKLKLAEILGELGYRHPEIYDDRIKFPAVMKPIRGGGGIKNRLILSEKDLPEYHDGFFFQEYIKGRSTSVSSVSDGENAISLTANEQLIGEKFLNSPSDFAYCGNIVPYAGKKAGEMEKIASQLASDLNLRGFNGVDFIVKRDEVFVIEVNPRLCGSLDPIELSTGLNVFDAHIKSIFGELPDEPEIKNFSGKAIIFAKRDVEVKKIITEEGFVDIPPIGKRILEGKPITTILATGASREIVLNKIGEIYKRALPKYL